MPGGKKRAEAFEDLKKARSLAKEAGDKKVGLEVSNAFTDLDLHSLPPTVRNVVGMILKGHLSRVGRLCVAGQVEATAMFVQANAAIKLRQNDDSYAFAQESYKLYEVGLADLQDMARHGTTHKTQGKTKKVVTISFTF